ncbi:sulfatase-like hydrolase/transferase [Methanofollis formosanus]|nr:sulfatase-like hydrolase/transferase [Methanofollis formosanus]
MKQKNEIVHDAEYYILEARHGEVWAAEDDELDARLEALRKKYGTPPNIVHIMWDDTAFGEVGIPHLQKTRGFETPNINRLAAEGIFFCRMYTEPSCTPSRAAVMTGRHAVRSGMYNVAFPYEYGGLDAEEVTMGTVLSSVGYATAFYGKWHLGDTEESYATNHGFDEALFTPYNQVPSIYTPAAENMGAITGMFPEMFPADPYDLDRGWEPRGYVWALEGRKEGTVREWGHPPDHEDYLKIDPECERRTLAFIRTNAKGGKPFYVAYWPQLASFAGFKEKQTVSRALLQEGLVRLDRFIGELRDELETLGIAENTLVVLMADNGPMVHNGPPGMVETIYRGGKSDYWEGGVRVAAFAWWPGMIAPGQIVGDMIHETDLFTTFARLGGALDHVPTDRIIDGVDQTSLLLNGDTFSRRDYNFIYTGPVLAATVKGRFKRVWVGESPGLTGAAFYDLYNDPREVQPKMLPLFPTKGMFNIMKARHEIWKQKYPDRKPARDFPLKGIENARPETLAASQIRVDLEKIPFDPREFIRNLPDWENIDVGWGAGEK